MKIALRVCAFVLLTAAVPGGTADEIEIRPRVTLAELVDSPLLASTPPAPAPADAAPASDGDPAPAPKTVDVPPVLAAPDCKIVMEEAVDVGELIHVEFEEGGGPVRERVIEIFDQDGKELPKTNIQPVDDQHFVFAAKPGVWTVHVIWTGRDKGLDRKPAAVIVRELPTPPAPPPAAASVKADGAKPDELFKSWAPVTANRGAEGKVIAQAAREIAQAARGKPDKEARAFDDWSNLCYARLLTAYAPWNKLAGGKSFFENMRDLFADNADKHKMAASELLDAVAGILEKL